MYLSSKDFRHTGSPCTGVETFRPQRLRYVVNMYDLATFGVDTEDIYGLAEFFRLKYNSLENLRNNQSRGASSSAGREQTTFALPSTSTIAK
jgi:hypothetical protein